MPSSPETPERVIAVAVPVPGLGLLSYRVRGRPVPPKGARVLVPLGARTVTGCVVGPEAAPEGARLRDVVEVLDDQPFLPPDVVDLALWVGEYYASGPGDALAVAMPPAARRGEKTSFRTTRIAVLASAVEGAGPAGDPLRGDRQRAAIDLLRAAPEGMAVAQLARRGVGAETLFPAQWDPKLGIHVT